MTIQSNTVKRKKIYWLITHWECPVCGKEYLVRERVADKPVQTHEYRYDPTCSYICA